MMAVPMAQVKSKKKLQASPAKAKSQRVKSKQKLTSGNGRTTKEGWRGNVQEILQSSEAKLEGLGKQIDVSTKKLEAKTQEKLQEFEKNWSSTQKWLEGQVERLRAVEAAAETAVDTTKVKVHLAKLDAADAVANWRERIGEVRSRLESLKIKTNIETAKALESLSQACLDLKNRLSH